MHRWRLLKEIIKKEYPAPVIIQPRPSGIKKEKKTPKPSTSGIKKETKGTKTPSSSKPSTGKSGGWKKAILTGATTGVSREIGVDPKFVDRYDTEDEDEGGYTPKYRGKGKIPKPRRPKPRSYKKGGRLGTVPPERL